MLQPEAVESQSSDVKKVAGEILFAELTNVLEEISKLPSGRGVNAGIGKNESKKRCLKSFIDMWRSTAKKMTDKDPANKALIDDNFFQVLRLLLPKEDRRIYNIKEAKLAALIIDALAISKNTDDGKKLLNYREHNSTNIDGDFAGLAFNFYRLFAFRFLF